MYANTTLKRNHGTDDDDSQTGKRPQVGAHDGFLRNTDQPEAAFLSGVSVLDQMEYNLLIDQPALFYPSGYGNGANFDVLASLGPDLSGTTGAEELILPDIVQRVCYGMLPDVEVQLKWPPEAYRHNPHVSGNGETYVPMQLELKSDHGLIRTVDGQAVAVLDKNSFRALSPCMRVEGFHVDAWVLEAEWNAKVPEAQNLRTSRQKIVRMKVDLLLFGPRGAGDRIAADLGSCQNYLQDPHAGLSSCRYENPQSLQVPEPPLGTQEEVDSTLPVALRVKERDETGDQIEGTRGRDLAQVADLITDIDAFFDQLPTHRSVDLASTDARILSSLFSHQKEALDFMIRREARSSTARVGLWEMKSLASGETYYQHSITGAKSKSADDFLGGILADDMGLGKTLTTLAAIVASMGRASDFGRLGREKSIAASKATVVIVPSELLLNTWAGEINRHLYPGSIRYIKYHGQNRRELDATLDQQDVILTTYGTVMAERRRGNGALHQIDWFRLVLDEAHMIRNWSSKQFNAVHSISSRIRWCLTGTPIQNSLDDLGSLIRFLGMPIFNETATFRKYVTKLCYDRGSTKGEFQNLRLILSSICLRRNKTILPNQQHQFENRQPIFTSQEREQYRCLELACKRAISVGSKSLGDDQSHRRVMEALLRLRMFCNNGLDGPDRSRFALSGSLSRPDEVLSFLQQSGEAICAYCSVDVLSIGGSSDPDSAYLTRCWRLVCGECTQQYRSGQKEDEVFVCPLCHDQHDMDGVYECDPVGRLAADKWYPSKIASLVQDVQTHYLGDKCVVFSFWKKTLDIVGNALEAHRIKYLRVDGDVPPKKRNTILLDFQNRNASRVLLMTFSTGAVGLNGLTVANRVHILEPQWNPSVENQAIGRVLRLDQQRKVTIVRYAMQRSIEVVVQTRQLRKLQLAGGGFISHEERRELRANQLQHLHEYLDSKESVGAGYPSVKTSPIQRRHCAGPNR